MSELNKKNLILKRMQKQDITDIEKINYLIYIINNPIYFFFSIRKETIESLFEIIYLNLILLYILISHNRIIN